MPKKVLVLEDEASIRGFIVINLTRAGYEVIEAESGEQKTENRKQKTETRGKRATDEAAEQSWCVFRENTKDTKNHKGTRRKTARMGNRRLRRFVAD